MARERVEKCPIPSRSPDPAETGGTLAPLKLRNAGEQIAERLVTAIALGEYVPGQRLPTERELSSLLGVNRASVRDALHRLAEAGYVDIQRGRHGGAYVRMSWGTQSAEMIRRTLDAELGTLRSAVRPPQPARAADRVARRRSAARPRTSPRSSARSPTTQPRRTARHHGRPTRLCMPAVAERDAQRPPRVSQPADPRAGQPRLRGRALQRRDPCPRGRPARPARDGDPRTVTPRRRPRSPERHFALTETALRRLLERVADDGEGERRPMSA